LVQVPEVPASTLVQALSEQQAPAAVVEMQVALPEQIR